MISTRNLSTHKKNVHGIGRNSVTRKYVRKNTVRDENRKGHKLTGGTTLEVTPNFPENGMEKCNVSIKKSSNLSDKQKPDKYGRHTKCEYCGISIYSRTWQRQHLLEVHRVQISDSGFKCLVCSKSYTNRPGWRRHLNYSDNCRQAVYGRNMLTVNEVGEVIVKVGCIPQTGDDEELVLDNDESLSIDEEDPLSF